MVVRYGPLGYLIGWVMGLFHVSAVLALICGGYVGYTKPLSDSDTGNHISEAAIQGAKETTEIVDNVSKWFGEQVSFDRLSTINPKGVQALLLIPRILIYYPVWAGAGAGGAIGGVFGDLAYHAVRKGEQQEQPSGRPSQEPTINGERNVPVTQ